MAITQFDYLTAAIYWTDSFGWTAGIPSATDVAQIGGDPRIESDVGTIAQLEFVSDPAFNLIGDLKILDGGALAVTGDVDDNSTIAITSLAHADSLKIGGTLILASGHLNVDASKGAGSGTVTANAFQDSYGGIILTGGASASGPTSRAQLLINAPAGFSAPGLLDSSVTITGNAALAFLSGVITTVTTSGFLTVSGPNAFLAAGTPDSNNALDGLSSNAGQITFDDGAQVQIGGDLTNTGNLYVDYDPFGTFINEVRGGASLKILGALNNSGAGATLQIGAPGLVADTLVEAASVVNANLIHIQGGTQHLAELRIDGAAGMGTTGVLQGDVALSDHALFDFKTGQITTIAGSSYLTIHGPNAHLADLGDETRNSALDGLSEIAGDLVLAEGAGASLTGAVDVTGLLDVEGGGSFTVNGALTSNGAIAVGAVSDTVGSTMTAGDVSNSGIIGVNSAVTYLTDSAAVGGARSALVVADLKGAGSVDLGANATLEIGGLGENSVHFSGANATLKLDNPALGYTGAITDFSAGDVLDLAHENASIVSYDGAKLVVRTAAGAIQQFALAGPSSNALATRRDGAGGTDIIVGAPLSRTVDDFNGDGQSDILWRNSDGDAYIYNSGLSGFVGEDLGLIPSSWQAAGVGDFNGDGKSDILWRNSDGDAYLYNSRASGFVGQDLGAIPTSWTVASVADFNADGEADILWRNSDGDAYIYNSNGAGGFTGQDLGVVPTSWTVAGTGDFNDDGRADILWRNSDGDAYIYDSNASGGFVGLDLGVIPTSWTVAGVGDFNGDAKADILWRNSDGDAYIYNSSSASAFGGFVGQDLGAIPTSWQVAGVADFNRDGKSDILWRNADGEAYIYNSNASGGFVGQDLGTIPNAWQIQRG